MRCNYLNMMLVKNRQNTSSEGEHSMSCRRSHPLQTNYMIGHRGHGFLNWELADCKVCTRNTSPEKYLWWMKYWQKSSKLWTLQSTTVSIQFFDCPNRNEYAQNPRKHLFCFVGFVFVWLFFPLLFICPSFCNLMTEFNALFTCCFAVRLLRTKGLKLPYSQSFSFKNE